jgi:hemolysin III
VNDFYLHLGYSMERKQRLQEEFANSITHGFGILFSIVAISLLVTFSVLEGSPIAIFSCSIFGGSILLLYTFSTLYHAFQEERVKAWLRTFDHVSIYFLIAGTYTPFLLIGIKGTLGWVMFGIIWTLAALGLIFKLYFINRFKRASLLLYLGMGWMAIFLIKPLLESQSTSTLYWIGAGGLCYTLGTLFYTRTQLPYAHTIWHLFVLGGSIMHFIAVLTMIQGG